MSGLPGLLVLLGHPVAHSISPRLQNAALRAAGLPLVYEALDVAPLELERVLGELAEANGAGNVTIPHKEIVAARCGRLTPLALRCAAVNTFWHEGGTLVGHNTDVGGADSVMRALLRGAVDGACVALVGAGGSAAAILGAVEGWGSARVAIYNRHMSRALALAARFPRLATASYSLGDALDGATLVVNATPLGMRDDDPHPVDIGALPADAAVFDLVYRAGETAWVRAARAAGHVAADGEGMLLEQGALAFAQWFGREPDRGAMWRAVH